MTSENEFFLKLPQELNLSRVFADLQPSATSGKKGLLCATVQEWQISAFKD